VRGIAIYTGLRVALLIGVWLLVQAVTPLRGLLAIAVALVISGVISFIVLDRSRDRASAGLSGAFRRINERIEQSTTAEDWDERRPSGEGDARTEEEPVRQDEQPGALQHGHEIATDRSTADGADGTDGQDGGKQSDPGEGESEPQR
jgi:hypothetical protein